MKTPLLMLLVLLALLRATAAPAQIEPAHRDVVVYDGEGFQILVDIYLPEGDGPFPTILHIHGGGWDALSKDQAAIHAPQVVPRGWALVATSYRLSDVAKFPAQVHDVKASVRWLRANGAEYNLDTRRIGAWGGSAGGHLAAMLALTSGDQDFEGDQGNLDQSSAVQAFVVYVPAVDLADAPPEFTILREKGAKYLGCETVEACPEKTAAANPLNYIDENDPPALIFTGGDDTIVPPRHSVNLNDALTSAGLTSDLVIFPGEGHGVPSILSDESSQRIDTFFRKHLLNGSTTWRVE